MKTRFFVALLLAVMLVVPSAAFAAGKLSYEENFFTAGDYSLYGYAFAKVENVGDKPITVNAGLLEIFDENGDPITSTDYLQAHAKYLQPGEYTYVKMYDDIDADLAGSVDDYLLTITGKSGNDYISQRFPCTFEYAVEETRYSTYHYIYVTVTNDTDAPVYDVDVVAALYDENDTLICVEGDGLYNVAITPGSSVTFRMQLSSNYVSYYADNGIVPSHVDAIAYVNMENPLAE